MTAPDPSNPPPPAASPSVFKSTRWNALGTGGVQGLRFLFALALFRLLGPERVGLMSMALVVTGFLDSFKDFGTGQAVVQREELAPGFLSSVFLLNLGLAVLLALTVAAGAPLAARFFGEPEVAPLLRLLAIGSVVTAGGIVHRSLLARAMRFDRLAVVNLSGALANGSVALPLAFAGYGVWSLAWGVLASALVSNVVVWSLSTWRPRLRFEWVELRSTFSFCAHLVASNLSTFALQNADKIVVGRFLGKEALGLYELGLRLVQFPTRVITRVLAGVLLPTFARLQGDLPQYRAKLLRACAGICMVTAPMMAGLAAVAPVLVAGLMKERWAGAAPLIMVLAPVGVVRSLANTTGTIYVSMGRTDLMLRWSLVFGLAVLGAYFAGLPWGVLGVACAWTVADLVLAWAYFAVPFRLIDLPVSALARSVAPYLAASAVMGALVAGARVLLERSALHPLLVLGLCVTLGAGLYAAFLWRVRPPAVSDLGGLLKLRRRGREAA